MCAALAAPAAADSQAGTSRPRGLFWPLPAPSATPHPAVVRVIAAEPSGMAQGSGALVGSRGRYGLVLTNWHVVRGAAGPITVIFPDGFQSAGRVLKADSDWDLAALLIWRPRAEPIPIAAVAPRPGDVLTIAGYGQGRYRAASGRCTQYVAPAMNLPYEMLELAAIARQGDSGGPILNERGELAGVLFGSSGGTTTGTYCGRAREFLASAWPAAEIPPSQGSSTNGSHLLAQVPDPPRAEIGQPSPRAAEPVLQAPPQPDATPDPPELAAIEPIPQPAVTPPPIDLSPSPFRLEDWLGLAGKTRAEQGKTLLAGIGLLAVLARLSKWLAGSGRKGDTA